MNLTDWKSAICSGGLFLMEIAMKIFKINMFKTDMKQDDNNYMAVNEILLYGAEHQELMQQIGLNNLLCIYYMILHARKSIDICVPSLISDSLAKCLINVHQKNKVKIRITIHKSDNFNNLQLFAQNGIEVKIIKPDVWLEHEFLLLDALDDYKDAVAVMGSLDYETNRVNCNRDTTVITSEKTVVTALKKEFIRVWNSVPDIVNAQDDKVN